MKNQIKYLLILLIILLITILIGGFYYSKYKSHITILKNGISFSYSKNLTVQEIPSTEGNYINYQVSNPNVAAGSRSEITVSVPLKNTSSKFTLSDVVKNETDPSKIIKTTINKHDCESILYRLDTNYPGDRPVHAFRTQISCVTKYEMSPLMLDYIKYDTDASLDKEWETIQKLIVY